MKSSGSFIAYDEPLTRHSHIYSHLPCDSLALT